ncbi:MBL fold metallo-hydrolase [Streptomonospora wellingtoniae]|uniref:MBL fold metallo-hydrolase n=1 Tax=Streptomonospora wellingtoniae TaxID=3075544 RepID=A0ABU2KSN8_9ACTN|nr:MBL fold metallo-hydrolase [Streptomonospora sp. DSM 45055]MDT0302299.1 MBL fold metallo-hydrolase [Streptomonospora sp. DSM 45055]
MFWKRKGKKQDGEEAGDSGAAAVATKGADTDKTADDAASESAEPATAEAEGGEAGKAGAAEKPGGAEKDGAAKPDGEAADSVGSEGEEAADETAEDTPAAESGKAGKPGRGDAGAKARKADEAERSGASVDGDSEEGEEEDAADEDGERDESDDTAPVVASVKPLFADEDEPETAGVSETDEEGVQRVRTIGVLKAEDQELDVVSNTWIVDADDEGVVVIDPAHDAEAIMEAVGDREVYLVACTNGYNTHLAAAIEVAERDEAPIALHRRELRAWRRVHGAEHRPDLEVEGGGSLKAGDIEVDILPIPGTSVGSVAYYIAEKGVVFTGDSLRKGEVGTVAGGYIDYTQQLHSIGEMILTLPPDTRVLPDSGAETSVGEESDNFDTWVSTR